MNENNTLEDALQSFAAAYKVEQSYRIQAGKRLKKLNGTLIKRVKVIFDLGGNANDCKEVLDSEGIAYKPKTVEGYFSGLTPPDKKQNTGGRSNPAIVKANKALAVARGENLAATSARDSIKIGLKYTDPFLAKSINENGKTTAPANASDLQKLQANVHFADAIHKGARAMARAAANLLKIAKAAVEMQVKMDAKTEKVKSNGKADKKTASKAAKRRVISTLTREQIGKFLVKS